MNDELSELRQAVGLATTAVPEMVMDAEHPIEMMQKVVERMDSLLALLREAREALHVSQYQGCGVDKELLSRIDAALREAEK